MESDPELDALAGCEEIFTPNKKRDTTLKHAYDLSSHENPIFGNLTQILVTFSVSVEDVRLMKQRITGIGLDNKLFTPDKWNESQNAAWQPYFQTLYEEFLPQWGESSYKLVLAGVTFLVQREKTNYNRRKQKTPSDEPIEHQQDSASQAPTRSPDNEAVPPLNPGPQPNEDDIGLIRVKVDGFDSEWMVSYLVPGESHIYSSITKWLELWNSLCQRIEEESRPLKAGESILYMGPGPKMRISNHHQLRRAMLNHPHPLMGISFEVSDPRAAVGCGEPLKRKADNELATPSPVRRKECQDANAQLSLTTPSPKFSTTKITSDSKSSLTPPRSSSPPQDELHLSNNRKQSEDDDIHMIEPLSTPGTSTPQVIHRDSNVDSISVRSASIPVRLAPSVTPEVGQSAKSDATEGGTREQSDAMVEDHGQSANSPPKEVPRSQDNVVSPANKKEQSVQGDGEHTSTESRPNTETTHEQGTAELTSIKEPLPMSPEEKVFRERQASQIAQIEVFEQQTLALSGRTITYTCTKGDEQLKAEAEAKNVEDKEVTFEDDQLNVSSASSTQAAMHMEARALAMDLLQLDRQDRTYKNPHFLVKIPHLKTQPFMYQWIGAVALVLAEKYNGGAYNADDMGLGKSFTTILVIWLSRIVAHNHVMVRQSQHKQDGKHLTEEQQDGAKCPSQSLWFLPCVCVKGSPTKKLPVSFGATIVIVPTNLVEKWLNEFRIHTRTPKEGGLHWEVENAYKKMGDYPAFDVEKGREYFTLTETANGKQLPTIANRLVVITSPKCFHHRFKDLLIDAQKKRAVKRVVVDEAHAYTTKGTQFPDSIKRTNCRYHMFLTGTPFEISPRQTKVWVDMLNWPDFKKPVAKDDDAIGWINNRAYSTPTHIENLHLMNREITNKLHGQQKKADDEGFQEELRSKNVKKYVGDTARFMTTISLRRSRTSIMFGYVVGQSHPRLHTEVKCKLHQPDAENIRRLGQEIIDKLTLKYELAVQKNKRQRIQTGVTMNNKAFELNAHKARVLSSWPPLIQFMKDYGKGLGFTLDEVVKNKWIQTDIPLLKTDGIAKLRTTRNTECPSPYEQEIRELCDEKRNPKWKAFRQLERSVWPKESRVVICCYAPVTAIILYWAISKVLRQSVSYVHNRMSKEYLSKAIKKFQSNDADAPRFLVGTTATIGKGLDLFRANILVQWEVEWLVRDESQARARVVRVGQTQPVLTYQFICANSMVELMTAYRHTYREHILEKVEKGDQEQEESEVEEAYEEQNAF